MPNLNIDVADEKLIEAITDSLDVEEIKKLILDLDLKVADCGFTTELIKDLLGSLKGDMSREEILKDLEN